MTPGEVCFLDQEGDQHYIYASMFNMVVQIQFSFNLYSANLQKQSSQGGFIVQRKDPTITQPSMNKLLVTVGRKSSLLTRRNQQNQARGGAAIHCLGVPIVANKYIIITTDCRFQLILFTYCRHTAQSANCRLVVLEIVLNFGGLYSPRVYLAIESCTQKAINALYINKYKCIYTVSITSLIFHQNHQEKKERKNPSTAHNRPVRLTCLQ